MTGDAIDARTVERTSCSFHTLRRWCIEREVVIEREFVDEAAGAPVIVEQPAPARLILDIHPPTAQVFADGYYIGIPEDFRFEDGGAVLEPGPHRIDILARDYEPVTFDVNLTRGQSATYRHTLTPIVRAPQAAPAAAAKAPPAPKQPVTFYLIPGCYMGNVPPKEANLPATCDITRAVSAQYLIALSAQGASAFGASETALRTHVLSLGSARTAVFACVSTS